jgi:hypothetical protein
MGFSNMVLLKSNIKRFSTSRLILSLSVYNSGLTYANQFAGEPTEWLF